MINVTINCDASPAEELVSKYNFYDGTNKLGESTSPSFQQNDVAAGPHSYSVKAVNILGEGPSSDPYNITLPSAVPGKVVNVTVNVNISI